MELAVVHLFADVDYALEVLAHLDEVVEVVVFGADVHHQVEHVLLALQRADGVNLVEGVLLEDNEVDDLALPERLVVIHGHAVVAKDVDLFLNLLTALQKGLHVVHFACPLGVDAVGDILFELGVLDVLGVGVDGVHGGVALAVGASLLQSVEASCHFLRTLGNGLLEVTTGRRNRAKESNRTCCAVVQIDVTSS